MKKIILIWLVAFCFLEAKSIKVAAAANVVYALEDIKKAFIKHHPQESVVVTVASSGKLTAQIMHGASYDIFLSANMFYPKKLYDAGYALHSPKVYAQGMLVLFSTQPRDFSHPFLLLQKENIKKIAIANPQTAPYGKAAFEVLYHKKLVQKLRKKFVYGESVGQTFLFALKVADIGFVAKSQLLSKQMRHFQEGIDYITLNPKEYSPINQGVVLLKNAQQNLAADRFYRFLFSKEAKKIFQQYGYKVD